MAAPPDCSTMAALPDGPNMVADAGVVVFVVVEGPELSWNFVEAVINSVAI